MTNATYENMMADEDTYDRDASEPHTDDYAIEAQVDGVWTVVDKSNGSRKEAVAHFNAIRLYHCWTRLVWLG